ncbi:MAG TPA: ATP-binding cassette domain-containing protein [Gemmatimonadaceae bacterium]
MSPPVLRIRALTKTYQAGLRGCIAAARALDDIHVEIRRGEVVALVGPAGAGKTTLLLCAAGLLTPDAGRGTIDREGDLNAIYFRDVVPANACADVAWDLALVDNVDRVRGDIAAAFALVSAIKRARANGGAVLLAARDARTVDRIADRILTLDRGRLQSVWAPPLAGGARVAELAAPSVDRHSGRA